MTRSPPPPHATLQLNAHIAIDVRQAVADKGRFCPMVAGTARIRTGRGKSHMVVRTATEEIAINAPTPLLNAVFEHCDGTRTFDEILGTVKNAGVRSSLSDFMDFLCVEGALIDGNLACAETAKFAHQFNPVGLAASPHTTGQIARRFSWVPTGDSHEPERVFPVPKAPLDAHFQSRITRYTFSHSAPPAEAVHALLWSLAGIVACTHPRSKELIPHRTLGSAGAMHLLEIYLVLPRALAPHASGVYRVHYPDARSIALEPVESDVKKLPLAFGKPWELTHAAGAVFIAADPVIAALRYRNRSLQYLFMEAGAALQNGALSADSLGLGYATIGGYYEGPIRQLCNLDRHLILGSCIFGSKPGSKDSERLVNAPDIEFAWVNTESPAFTAGFHLARARIKSADEDHPYTWGRSTDPGLAMRKAICEAIERQGFREPRNIVVGAMADIPNARNPESFVAYSPGQYRRANFPYRPFSAKDNHLWARGHDLVTGEAVHVLAELVYARSSLVAAGHEVRAPYTQTNSSGCAAGTTSADATIRALLEVIERHAFMLHWLRQAPGQELNPACLGGDIASRLRALENTGCKVNVQRLDTDLAHVALVAAQHAGLRFTTIGTAADFDFSHALESALDELDARVFAWLNGHTPSVVHPTKVKTTEHHFELYGQPKHHRRADAVLFPAQAEQLNSLPPAIRQVGSLAPFCAHIAQHAAHPIAVDITPQRNCLDQGSTPIHVVKAFIPGLLPMSFGFNTEPLGLYPGFHPASRFPHPFP